MITNWIFKKGSLNNGHLIDCDTSEFENIIVPHTWNNLDGQDGCPNGKTIKDTDYYKGDGWYRTYININDCNKRYFLRFEGANSQATVYVNEKQIGHHKGGYTAFCYEITDFIHKGSDNLIAVKVSNSKVPEIAPLQADFTFYGGIYRNVDLIEKETASFNITKNGTRGIKITTPNVSKEKADCIIETTVENKSKEKQIFIVEAKISNEHIQEKEIILNSGECKDIKFDFTISNPHLWNGRKDPYLYSVKLSLKSKEKTLDELNDQVGFRYYNIDINKGFYLNGNKYPLRGVSRHQDREKIGNALTKAHHDEDFKILFDIGANAVRLAHYPQSEYFYELCDRAGILVWAEIPFVELIGGNGSYETPDDNRKAFFDCTKLQLKELILQNFNHPSIFCWGIQNEVLAEYNNIMIPFSKELHFFAKTLDPYRYTTQATNQKSAYEWTSDLICWNVYPGWYGMNKKSLGKFMDRMKTNKPIGISEYGAGANYNQQENKPKRIKHNGQWHPEQYQTICHEAYLKEIDKRDCLWCTFVWNLFDFGSDGRNEGKRPGMNDKGLVSFDRKTKKDAYYLYQAHWSDTHMLYITENRYTKRRKKYNDIKIFSNSDEITLYINGKYIRKKYQSENDLFGRFIWKKCKLNKGENTIKAIGTNGNSNIEKSIIIYHSSKYNKKQIIK